MRVPAEAEAEGPQASEVEVAGVLFLIIDSTVLAQDQRKDVLDVSVF